MVAPSVLRVQTIENIFVEIQDCAVGTNINVQISAMNHPAKNKQLGMDTVALNGSNSCQAFGKILVMWKSRHAGLSWLGVLPNMFWLVLDVQDVGNVCFYADNRRLFTHDVIANNLCTFLS